MRVCLCQNDELGRAKGIYFRGTGSSFFGSWAADTYGAKRCAIVAVLLGDTTKSVSSVNFNSFALAANGTQIASFTASGRKLEVWAIRNIEIAQIGNLSVTLSGSSDYVAFAGLLFGVDPDASFGATVTASATSTAPSASVSDAEDYVLSFLGFASETITASATDVWPIPATGSGGSGARSTSGAGSPCTLIAGEYRGAREGVAAPQAYTLSSSVAWLEIAISVHRYGRETSAYTAWRNSLATDRTVLVELEAGEKLEGFTGSGGGVAPSVLGSDSSSVASASSLTFAHGFAGGSNRMLIVFVTYAAAVSISSITHNGSALTKLDGQIFHTTHGLDIWYLASPASSGNVVITASGSSTRIIASAHTLKDASGFRARGSNSGNSNTPTSTAGAFSSGDLALSAIACFSGPNCSPGAGETELADLIGPAFAGAIAAYSKTANGSFSETLSGVALWGAYAFAVTPAIAASIYQLVWPQFVRTSINGGLRRKLLTVEENGTRYRDAGSLVTLNTATEGAFFYDTAAETLYIRTSSGVSPSSFSAITAVFRIHLATREVDFVGGEYYEPRLVGALPSNRDEAQDLLFGIKAYPGGEIALQNSDGLFDTLSASWLWRNRTARAFLGGGTLARTDYKLQSEMLIEDFQAGTSSVLVKLRAGADAIQSLVPTLQASLGIVGTGNAEADSSYMPIAIGTTRNVAPLLYSFAGGVAQYIIADSYFLPSVSNVRARNLSTGAETALANGADYGLSFSSGLLVFNATYSDPSVYQIRCDVTGLTFGALLSPTFGSICLDFLRRYAVVDADLIDRESFFRSDLYSPALAFYSAERQPIAELFRFFEKSCLATCAFSPEGFWRASVWLPSEPDFDLLPVLELSNMQGDPVPEPAPSTPLYEVIARYGYQPALDKWSEASSSDLGVVGLQRTRQSETLNTALSNSAEAKILADRYAAIQNAATKAMRFLENGFSLIDRGVFDRLLITLDRAQSATGSYTRELHEITEITKTLNPPAIEIVAANIQGLGNMARAAAPDSLSAITWDTATAEQKAAFIFACDDTTERADPLDATTYAQNRAW